MLSPRRALLILFLCSPLAAFGHAGHDHDAPASALPLAPRAEAYSDQIEALAVLENGELRIYLDEFATNAPIDGAELEIEVGGEPRVAEALGDGVYRLPANGLEAPGEHSLLLGVQTDTLFDLLALRLVVPEGTDSENARGGFAATPQGLLGGGALLVLLGLAVGYGLGRGGRRHA
jgi:membrane fusion protein, heavy metal efflux system